MGFFDDIFDFIGGIVEDVISWIIPIPEIPDIPQQEQSKGTLINKQSNNANIPIVYGERLVGGTRVFLETSGADNEYLYGAIVLSEGEINAITEIKIDDEVVTFDGVFADGSQITSTGDRFGTTITIQPFYGSAGQSASSLLTTLSSWGSLHKLSGLAYIAFRISWDNEKFTSIPKIQAKVQGKKVVSYNASLIAQSPAYSTNPAWCLLDYLTNTIYGKGINVSDIDLQSFYNASQTAITQVTPYSGGSDINLFDCNAVIDTQQKIIDNVRFLLRGMRGFLPYTQGKYKLILEESGTASLNLNKDNIIGGIKLSSEKKNEKYNRININYINPEKNYEVDTIVYPETDAEHQTLKTEDGGFLQEFQLDLQMITNPYQALEFGKVVLNRSRNQLGLTLTANYSAMDLAIGDIVSVTDDILGMSAKPFRVVGLSINLNYTVQLSLIEHQNSWYTWEENIEQPVVPDSNLPNPFSVEAPSIDHSDELISLFDGSVVSKLTVTVNSNDRFVNEYEVQIKPQSDTNFITIGRSTNKVFEKYPVIEGLIYDIRARAINSLGVSSAYTTSQHEVNSAFEPPDDVTGYTIDVVGDKLHHSFNPVTNLDLRFYEIRYSSDITKTNYADTTVLVERIARPATSVVTPYQQGGIFMIKAVDKFGVRSTNYDSVIVTEQVFGEKQNTIQTITEHTAFSGSKTNCVVVDNTLRLDTSINFDDLSGDFDDAEGFFDGGGGNIVASGTYDFNTDFDFGAKFKFNLQLDSLVVQNLNYVNNFDSKQGLFDSAEGFFDGGENASVSTDVQLYVATSDDAVTYGNYTKFKAGDYNTRAIKLRAILTSINTEETPVVEQLSIRIALPKRSEEGSNISSGTDTAGKVITFSFPFYQTPTVTIIAQDLQTGDYFNLNSKSTDDFNIEFFDSGGNTVNRTFDYQVIGIGQQQ
jgi:hypothetical protein